MVDLPKLLGALPGHEHLDVTFVGVDRLGQTRLLAVGESFGRTAQQVPDPVERVVLVTAVAVDSLLDPASHLVDGLTAELDHMERVEDRR